MKNTNTSPNTSTVQLITATPNGDELLGYMARVSNKKAKPGDPSGKLLKYLLEHNHWSPFEMCNAVVCIECPRDIARQILRHRSFSFQEFSGRYAEYLELYTEREGRLQDHKNRQNSLPCTSEETLAKWSRLVSLVRRVCFSAYDTALRLGIAKEVARALLPEGLVPTRLYMNGTLRSWIHYWSVRCTPETQKEHREIAEETRRIVLQQFPGVAAAIAVAQEHSDPKAHPA